MAAKTDFLVSLLPSNGHLDTCWPEYTYPLSFLHKQEGRGEEETSQQQPQGSHQDLRGLPFQHFLLELRQQLVLERAVEKEVAAAVALGSPLAPAGVPHVSYYIRAAMMGQ